ncbi:MAG: hypothetical protein WBB25_22930 [Sulfitobacter sp.]
MTATSLAAQTLRVEGRINVSPVAGGFLVEDGGGNGARGMWCAASEYARRVLGASGTQRIYVTGPLTSSNRRAPVRFSLDPGGTTPSRVTILGVSIYTAGASLSVDHAIGFCADFRLSHG